MDLFCFALQMRLCCIIVVKIYPLPLNFKLSPHRLYTLHPTLYTLNCDKVATFFYCKSTID